MTRPAERPTLYLVGFMYSGKSVVGARVARALGIPFIDLDQSVEQIAGTTIAELFRDRGEAEFRALESGALAAVAGSRVVVATGGGAPLLLANRERMRATGIVLWLKVPFAVTLDRAKGDSARVRPLWKDEPSFRDLWVEREGVYSFADLTVELTHEDPDRAAQAVLSALATAEVKV